MTDPTPTTSRVPPTGPMNTPPVTPPKAPEGAPKRTPDHQKIDPARPVLGGSVTLPPATTPPTAPTKAHGASGQPVPPTNPGEHCDTKKSSPQDDRHGDAKKQGC